MSTKKKAWVKSVFTGLPAKQQLIKNPPTTPAKSKSLKRSHSFAETTKTPNARNNELFKNCKHNKIDTDNWIDSFAPIHVEDLALHAKKLQELQDWFRHCDAKRKQQYPAQLCLITGPSGVGKTAAVRVCAEAHHYQVQEWINPVDQEVVTRLGDQDFGDQYVGSQVDAFKSFLLRASRYKSILVDKYNKRLLLVEDFPNALINDAVAFEEIIANYMSYGKSPLLFIVADAKSRGLNISYNLFNDQLKMKYPVNHISFNPIAATLLQKAMKRFCTIMRQEYADLYTVPQPIVLDSIVVSAQGDIRNALINLHFSSLKGAPALQTKMLLATGAEKTKRKRESKLKTIGRDESVTMMHALGRVFNPKLKDDQRLLHSPEEIAEQFATEPKKFIDFVHANYLPHFKQIEHVVAASSDLCIADVLMKEYREDMLGLLGLNIGVRSIMSSNKTPVSAWLPTRGPKRLNIADRASASSGGSLLDTAAKITTSLFATDYSTFVKIIEQKNGSDSAISVKI